MSRIKNSVINHTDFELDAGEKDSINITGKRLYVKESSGVFEISLNSGGIWVPVECGIGLTLEDDEQFTEVHIRNLGDEAVSGQLYYGTVGINDARLNTIVTRLSNVVAYQPSNFPVCRQDIIPTGQVLPLAGSYFGKKRVQLTMTADGGDLALVHDMSGIVKGLTLPDGVPLTYFSDGTFYVKNPNAGNVVLRRFELIRS